MKRRRAARWAALAALAFAARALAAEPAPKEIRVTVVYDNRGEHPAMQRGGGFSCLVRGLEKTILFDTGAKGDIWMRNARALGIDPSAIDVVILSHAHGDHTGGLLTLLERNPGVTVHLPPGCPPHLAQAVENSGARVREPGAATEVCRGAHLTAVLGDRIREHALVVRIAAGLAVITGCAHPGVVEIAESAGHTLGTRVDLVLGGFHLPDRAPAEIAAIARRLKAMGVRSVGPTHCTGAAAIECFREAFGAGFIETGLGTVCVWGR